MFMDYVLNGQGHGAVGEVISQCRFDPGLLRPHWDGKHKVCVLNTGRMTTNKAGKSVPIYEKVRVKDLMYHRDVSSPVFNATALRKDEWTELDKVVVKASRRRLSAWTDLESRSSFGGFNGMGKMILEHETMSDPGFAHVDFDGLTEGDNDHPMFQLEGVPLPIIHSDYFINARKLAISRNSGTPLDTTMAEAASRRVAETVERILLGVSTGPAYGDSTKYGRASAVYGYLNFPNRIIKNNFTAPTGSNPEVTVSEILTARELLYDAGHYGPFMVYTSTDWDLFLDNDYARLGGDNASITLRDRIRKIEGIEDVKRLDYLSSATNPFTLIMVEMVPEVVRAINGMGITVVQWESVGGMRLNFKVMCIMVPELRADFYGNTGILHGTTS